MSSAEAATGTELGPEAARILARALEIIDSGDVSGVSDLAVQQLLQAGTRLYFAKRDSGNKLAAFSGPDVVTAGVTGGIPDAPPRPGIRRARPLQS